VSQTLGAMNRCVLTLCLLTLYACGGSEPGGNIGPTDPGTNNPGGNNGNQPTVVGTITSSGGTLTAAGGAVVLTFPAGAVNSSVGITVDETSQVPNSNGLVTETTFEFGPDGTTFAEPVELTIAYDGANIPAGLTEVSLGLYKASGSSWDEVAWVEVDTVAKTVKAQISSFSTFGIRGGRVENIAGEWWVEETVIKDECENLLGAAKPWPISIAQSGSSVTVTFAGEDFLGTVDGSVLRWNGSFEDGDGTTQLDLLVTISPGGDKWAGRSNWSYTVDGETCSGMSTFEGTRAVSTHIAEIRITPRLGNVAQAGSAVTVYPEIGKAFSFDVQAFDNNGDELPRVLVNMSSSEGIVLNLGFGTVSVGGIPSSRGMMAPVSGFHPGIGEAGVSTLTASVNIDEIRISTSLVVTVERELTSISLSPPTTSLINNRGIGFEIKDANPAVAAWVVERVAGVTTTAIDTLFPASSCGITPTGADPDACVYWTISAGAGDLTAAPFWAPFGVDVERPPSSDGIFLQFRGFNGAGTEISYSGVYNYQVAPHTFQVKVGAEANRGWTRWGDDGFLIGEDTLQLALHIPDVSANGVWPYTCSRDLGQFGPEVNVSFKDSDGRVFESDLVAEAQCSGNISVGVPIPFVNGTVIPILFGGTVWRSDTQEVMNISGRIDLVSARHLRLPGDTGLPPVYSPVIQEGPIVIVSDAAEGWLSPAAFEESKRFRGINGGQ